MSRGERKAMITREHPELSLSRQCEVLSISRSSFYHAPKGESPATLALMRRIDELFLKYPFYGSRQMARQLRREGVRAGRHRVRRVRRENDSLDHFLILLTPADGSGGHLPSAENQRAAPGAQDLSLSAQGAGDRPAQPGLRVALEALRGDRTVQEIAAKHQEHPNQVSTWKRQAIDGLGEVFSNGVDRARSGHEPEVKELHAKIGELTVVNDFLARGLKR